MNKELFLKRRDNLINFIIKYIRQEDIVDEEKKALNKVLEILSEYSFENRLQKKGLLSHTIIDSLILDYSLGEKLIKFDDTIK